MADQTTYTRIPNAILDQMATMHQAELRVVLAIVRKTHGWQKPSDVISLSQLAAMTGLSRQGVVNGIEAAIAHGIVVRSPSGKNNGYSYQVVNSIDYLEEPVVNSIDQSTELTSQLSRLPVVNSVDHLGPQVVNSVDTQKKDSKERAKERERVPRALKQTSLNRLTDVCQVVEAAFGRKLNPATADLIVGWGIDDIPKWERNVAAYAAKYERINTDGLKDWYLADKAAKNGAGRNGGAHGPTTPGSFQRPAANPERAVLRQATADDWS